MLKDVLCSGDKLVHYAGNGLLRFDCLVLLPQLLDLSQQILDGLLVLDLSSSSLIVVNLDVIVQPLNLFQQLIHIKVHTLLWPLGFGWRNR